MKITIVQGAFLPIPPMRGGAVEKVWHALGQEFARQGHQVTHLSRRFPGLANEEIMKGMRHVRIPGFDAPKHRVVRLLLDFIYSWRVKRYLPEADIVVTNTFWLPVLLRSKKYGRLYVHVARFPKKQMFLYRHADRIQTVSHVVANAIATQEPLLQNRVAVIPYPVSQVKRQEAGVLLERKPTLLYAGRIHPEKGCDLLIRAFIRALDHIPPSWLLRLVGPWRMEEGGGGEGYFQQLKNLAGHAAGRVHLDGPEFSERGLAQCYQSAQLMVYPSLAEKGETFGLAVLEAMSNGCPVLVSNLECFQDFIQDGKNGFIFDHRRPDPEPRLMDRLVELLGDPAKLEQAGEAADTTARKYSIEKIAKLYLDDFTQLIRESTSAS